MQNVDPALYEKYGQFKVDESVKLLTYHMEMPPLPKDENPEFPILYVFRHGETEDNKNMVFSGWRDPNITEEGKKQTLELAQKLKDKNIQLLFASDQTRALETMQAAISLNEYANKLEINQDGRIREKSYGIYQGKSKLEVQLENPEHAMQLRRSYNYIPNLGESLHMCILRVNDFLNEIIPMMKESHMNVAISCHGNSIRGIRQYFEHLSNEQTAHIETPLGKDYAAYAIK